MKNILFILFMAFTLFLAIYFYWQFQNTQQQLALANRQVLDRDTIIYKLQKKGASFTGSPANVDTTVRASPSNLGKLSAAETDRLRNKGLRDPEADLKADLTANQEEVLTQKGALGGTMAIRDIQILNERYALAYFEDGHVGGYMVLRFQVGPAGRITWTVLDHYQI